MIKKKKGKREHMSEIRKKGRRDKMITERKEKLLS